MGLSLSPNILMESNNLKDFPSYYPVTESYLYSALNFIHETNDMYKANCTAFYEAVALSDTDEAITEAYSEFVNKAVNRVKKAISFIIEKINQFINYMSKYINEDKALQDRKDFVINSFVKNKLSFKCDEIYLGDEILFDNNIPVMDNIFDYGDSDKTKEWIGRIMNRYGTATDEQIKHTKEEMNDFLVDESDKTDNIRGILVGKPNEHISAQEYPKFLRDLFIGKKQLNVTVDASYLTDLFTELKDYHALLNTFKSKKKDIDNRYKSIIESLKSTPIYLVKDKSAASVRDFAEEFQRRLAGVAIERINAHMMALSVKMDCIKQIYRQDRSLIMKAISVATTKKSGTENSSDGEQEPIAASADLLMAEKDVMTEAEFDYMTTMFFIDEMASQSGMVIDVKAILTEAGVEIPIQEAVSLKDILDNLVSTIANMYTTFITWFEKLSGNNAKFLKDNKNVIITNPYKDEVINNIYPYDIGEITKTGIPALYYEQIKANLDTKEAFIKAEFTKYANDYTEDSSFRDIVKTDLCGSAEKKSLKTSELPSVAEMYSFCTSFSGGDGAYAAIKRDIRTLNNSNKEMARIIKEAQPKPTTAQNASFVYEVEIGNEGSSKGQSGDNSSQPSNDNAASSTNKAGSEENIDAMDKSKADIKADATEDVKKTTTRIKNYFGVCGDYLAAKFTVARWAYVDYMKILRWHASQYSAKEEEGSNAEGKEGKAEEGNKNNSEPIDIENPEKK